MSPVTLRLALALLGLSGCAAIDPLTRDGVWQPTGANDENLKVMLANPADYVSGASDPVADGAVVAAAVSRYRAGKVRRLPDSGLAKIVAVPTAVSSQSPGEE